MTTFNVGDKVWVIDSDDENYHCGGDIIELGSNLGLPHDREYRVAIELAESGEHWTEPIWYRAGQIEIAPGEKFTTD